MTSTMKSELGMPPACMEGCGVAVSAAASTALGRSADGRGEVGGTDGATALDASAASGALAAPVTATPARNLRRFNRVCDSSRAMSASVQYRGSEPDAARAVQMAMLVQ